jgi:iron(III) transport system substrate-binding protein
MIRKILAGALALAMMFSLVACGGGGNGGNAGGDTGGTSGGTGEGGGTPTGGDNNRVVLYSALEDFREAHFVARLKEQFPNYEIVLEYIPTGELAAKVKAEGSNTDGDIVVALDTGYMEALSDSFADLSAYDYSEYLPDLVPEKKTHMVLERWSGCIALNTIMLEQEGLPAPTSYQDLLRPEYQGKVIMPNPKSSGTAYFFLYQLSKVWGEDEAFAYFDDLSKNILQFTTSGSAPINALLDGEAAIALGMTFKAVNERNNGAPLEILYFDEGAPYATSSCGILKGKETRPAVQEVFTFLMTTINKEDKKLFSPEIIFKDQTIEVDNYPEVPYADMTGYFDEDVKLRLLDKWKF